MDPATVFAEWTLGRIPGEKLSLIASALVADGFAAPTLRALAEKHSGSNGEDSKLLATAMGELGIARPNCEEAAMLVSKQIAGRLVAGELTPRDACADIASLGLGCDERVEGLADFFYLLEEWERAAEGELGDLTQAEGDIREAARRLLDGERPLADA